MITIDGSYGEGGGQILRTSLAFSAIFQEPILIENIRAKRSKPGLRPQHLTCVKAMAKITGAKVDGAEIGSSRLYFHPRAVHGGDYMFDVAERMGSAGSVGLIFQTLLLPLSLAEEVSVVTLRGGTHVPWSPPYHYLSDVFLPMVSKMGIRCTLEIIKWGWYPKGGGEVRAIIRPVQGLKSVSFIEPLKSPKIEVTCASSNLPSHITEREKARIEGRLKEKGFRCTFRTLDRAAADGQGNFVFLCAKDKDTVVGFSSLGKPGKKAEKVADEVVDAFFRFLEKGAAIDRYLSDQIVPYMAMVEDTSVIFAEEISKHLLTNIWAIQKFKNISFRVEGIEGEKGKIIKGA